MAASNSFDAYSRDPHEDGRLTELPVGNLNELTLPDYRHECTTEEAPTDEATARQLFSLATAVTEHRPLGNVTVRRDIPCYPGEFKTYPDYKVPYPSQVLEALGELYKEYNAAFRDLVELNREWPTDYQYCFDRDGEPVNYFVQIDMVGLPTDFLEAIPLMTKNEIKTVLRSNIFEIENSLAGYELLQKIFAPEGTDESLFKNHFRKAQDDLRNLYGRPIALLAVTEEKYGLMKAYEFGAGIDESLSNAEVRERSGFDALWGPEEFKQHLEENGGECEYLLYVRSSSPTAKLKNPQLEVKQPLLADEAFRRVIKANAITFNVDGPEMDGEARINDTKSYLLSMGLAFHLQRMDGQDPFSQIFTSEFMSHLSKGRPYHDFPVDQRLTPAFTHFLSQSNVDPLEVAEGRVMMRFKPEKESYGAYGHERLVLSDSRKRRDVKNHIKKRGSYVVQPEMSIPTVENETDGTRTVYIDRNFFAFTSGHPSFMGGFRTMMQTESNEARNGRVHGSIETIWAEIARKE